MDVCAQQVRAVGRGEGGVRVGVGMVQDPAGAGRVRGSGKEGPSQNHGQDSEQGEGSDHGGTVPAEATPGTLIGAEMTGVGIHGSGEFHARVEQAVGEVDHQIGDQ